MKHINLILISIIISCFTTNAQSEFGLKLDGGVSKVTEKYTWTTNYFSRPALSGNVGIYSWLQLSKHSVLDIELLLSYIRSNENDPYSYYGPYYYEYDEYIIDASLDYVQPYSHTNKRMFYLSLPVRYGYKIGKFTLLAGAQISISLAGTNKNETDYGYPSIYRYPKSYTIYSTGGGEFDLGLNGGLSFDITNRIKIEAAYYHSMRKFLYTENARKYIPQTQQLTVGLRYAIIK